MIKGIILAGGKGTRLLPATRVTNKHLLPIVNNPMILYPIETLKTLGITNILIVSGGNHIGAFADFLGDGSGFGVDLTYRVQKDAGGVAHALGVAKDFAEGADSICVILGDNIFENNSIKIPSKRKKSHAVIFGKEVADPERFGVLCANKDGMVTKIEEKPKKPLSNVAVTGLYIYPTNVFDVIKTLKPSKRGELEITDVNNHYIKRNRCLVQRIEGFWSDAGTPESLARTTQWVIKGNKKIV